MLDIQQKRKLRFYMYHRFTLGLLFLVVLLAGHSTWVVYEKKAESQALMNISKQRVDDLRKRNDDLDYKIGRLETEVGIEEEIRSKFSVTKDNESMVVIVPKDIDTPAVSASTTSYWRKILDFFK